MYCTFPITVQIMPPPPTPPNYVRQDGEQDQYSSLWFSLSAKRLFIKEVFLFSDIWQAFGALIYYNLQAYGGWGNQYDESKNSMTLYYSNAYVLCA